MEYMCFFEKNGSPKIWLFWGRILVKIFEWIFLEGFFVGKYDFKIQENVKNIFGMSSTCNLYIFLSALIVKPSSSYSILH